MNEERTLSGRQQLARLFGSAAHLSLALFLFLVLITPSWRYGPFSWWPIIERADFAGGPLQFGLLNLLPALAAAFWFGKRILAQQGSVAGVTPWQWGSRHTTLPLLGLSLLGLISLTAAPARIQFIQIGGLLLAWLVYLFVLNERPNLQAILAAIVLVQGIVAIGQFLMQGDLGLVWLGELPLNPIFEGVSVIFARDHPWLRAYGLTAHPNFLGAIQTALLLLLLPTVARAKGWRGLIWYPAVLIGSAGLILTFSRGAGLGFVAGLLTWLLLRERPHREKGRFMPDLSHFRPLRSKYLKFILPLLLLIPLLFLYGDLFLSRLTNLDTPSEAQSINQRVDDAKLALQLIAENPLTGVGLGTYSDVAKTVNPEAARVHNVLLYVTAELGLPGLILLLCLLLSPFTVKPLRPAALAPWVAMLVIGLFDTTLWLTSNWQTAVLFGLLAANLWAIRSKPSQEPTPKRKGRSEF